MKMKKKTIKKGGLTFDFEFTPGISDKEAVAVVNAMMKDLKDKFPTKTKQSGSIDSMATALDKLGIKNK